MDDEAIKLRREWERDIAELYEKNWVSRCPSMLTSQEFH